MNGQLFMCRIYGLFLLRFLIFHVVMINLEEKKSWDLMPNNLRTPSILELLFIYYEISIDGIRQGYLLLLGGPYPPGRLLHGQPHQVVGGSDPLPVVRRLRELHEVQRSNGEEVFGNVPQPRSKGQYWIFFFKCYS